MKQYLLQRDQPLRRRFVTEVCLRTSLQRRPRINETRC
jgi:hypothetical protein